MNARISLISLVALLVFVLWTTAALAGCALLGPENDDVAPDTSFFPLEVGTTWTFAREDLSRPFSLPDTFRTTVVSSRLIDGEKYFMVEGFFIPARIDAFPTVEVRRDRCCVFLLLDGVEHLMYDFDGADTTWTVPLADEDGSDEFVVVRSDLLQEQVSVNWNQDPGRSEGYFDEVFVRGVGRSRVTLHTTFFGSFVWNLIATKDPE